MIGLSSIMFLLPDIVMGGTSNGSSVKVTTTYFNPTVSNSSIRNNALFPYSYINSNESSDLISYIPNTVYNLF